MNDNLEDPSGCVSGRQRPDTGNDQSLANSLPPSPSPAVGFQNVIIDLGPYVSVDNCIGKGAFASIYKGKCKATDRAVAIKVIDIDMVTRKSSNLRQHLASEIRVLQALSHENIVQLLDVYHDNSLLFLIMEFCEGGDLATHLKSLPGRRMREEEARFYMRQLAEGLQFLRSHDIIHRDLKPQNLLLGELFGGFETPEKENDPTDAEGDAADEQDKAQNVRRKLKIGDFGFARHIDQGALAETLVGTPLYMSPEIMAMKPYSPKADLWSVGAILFEMVIGRPPFRCRTPWELRETIEKMPITFPSSVRLSPSLSNLILSLLQKDPIKRIDWNTFFAHPWIGLAPPHDSPSPSRCSLTPSPPLAPVGSNTLSPHHSSIPLTPSPPTGRTHNSITTLSTISAPAQMAQPSPHRACNSPARDLLSSISPDENGLVKAPEDVRVKAGEKKLQQREESDTADLLGSFHLIDSRTPSPAIKISDGGIGAAIAEHCRLAEQRIVSICERIVAVFQLTMDVAESGSTAETFPLCIATLNAIRTAYEIINDAASIGPPSMIALQISEKLKSFYSTCLTTADVCSPSLVTVSPRQSPLRSFVQSYSAPLLPHSCPEEWSPQEGAAASPTDDVAPPSSSPSMMSSITSAVLSPIHRLLYASPPMSQQTDNQTDVPASPPSSPAAAQRSVEVTHISSPALHIRCPRSPANLPDTSEPLSELRNDPDWLKSGREIIYKLCRYINLIVIDDSFLAVRLKLEQAALDKGRSAAVEEMQGNVEASISLYQNRILKQLQGDGELLLAFLLEDIECNDPHDSSILRQYIDLFGSRLRSATTRLCAGSGRDHVMKS